MQWIVFGFLVLLVVTGVRRMARADKQAVPDDVKEHGLKSGPHEHSAPQIHEMVQCSQCNAYMVKNAPACDKAGCPFGR